MRPKPGPSYLYAALASALLLLSEGSAHAQNTVVRFLAGGAAGLVVHEAGHIATGLAMGADPGVKRLDYGVIPFFAITHDTVSRRREYIIASSGFHAQHLANELLLRRGSSGAGLRSRDSAFRKGWLTFNLATSAVYTAAALGRFGAPERDSLGMARHAGNDGMPEPVIGVMLLVPAALDGVRYVYGDPAWARWTSRAVKAGLVLVAVR
ncbi:MAG: hypothetical protein M3Q55_03685 [Acidobacteriota bacterium]|nr:hypothetical protein [Acidobacteriota bacterium]